MLGWELCFWVNEIYFESNFFVHVSKVISNHGLEKSVSCIFYINDKFLLLLNNASVQTFCAEVFYVPCRKDTKFFHTCNLCYMTKMLKNIFYYDFQTNIYERIYSLPMCNSGFFSDLTKKQRYAIHPKLLALAL